MEPPGNRKGATKDHTLENKSFQDEIAATLGNTDPSSLDPDTLASTIRTVTVDAAQNPNLSFQLSSLQRQSHLFIRNGNSGNLYRSLEFESLAPLVNNIENYVLILSELSKLTETLSLSLKPMNSLKHLNKILSKAIHC